MSTQRKIATFYLPISVDTFVSVQHAMEQEFPDAVLTTDPRDNSIVHVLDRPVSEGDTTP